MALYITMASCSVSTRPLPELIEKVRRGEIEVPPKDIRRIYAARLDRAVRPYLDIEIPESLARTSLGGDAIAERAELIGAYEREVAKYVHVGSPSTLMIAAPGGWQIHIDLAVSVETVGSVEIGTLPCSRYLVIGSAVRATAQMAEQNMAQRGLLGGPDTYFQFTPLPPPPPPRAPAFDLELEMASPVDKKGHALPIPAVTNSISARIARWKSIAGEAVGAPVATPFVPQPPAARSARWKELAAWLEESGVAFGELPRPVIRAALKYQYGLGPGWRAKFRLPTGDFAEIEYGWSAAS